MAPESSFISHLVELRNRLLRALASVLLVFLCLAYFAQDLYTLVATPLLDVLPEGASMIATDVAAPFFAPFKLTMVLSLFVAMPYILYQIWSFLAPGLYDNEKRMIGPLMASSSLLFYAGMAFAYFVLFPVAFAFFSSVAPEGVQISTDINSYLTFVLKIFFAFGLAFEVPVAIVLLCWTGATNAKRLRQKRPHVIVGAFVVGMLLTPPDVISQVLLAIPIWLLFELGVIVGGLVARSDDASEEMGKSP